VLLKKLGLDVMEYAIEKFNIMKISVTELTTSAFEKCPVWEFVEEPSSKEVHVQPFKQLPLKEALNKIITIKAKTAIDLEVWLAIVNFIDNDSISIITDFYIQKENKKIKVNQDEKPSFLIHKEIAELLGIDNKNIFPITYNLENIFITKNPIRQLQLPY
jgi:hypothetical protein